MGGKWHPKSVKQRLPRLKRLARLKVTPSAGWAQQTSTARVVFLPVESI